MSRATKKKKKREKVRKGKRKEVRVPMILASLLGFLS
jgi:hypothetical protein